MQKSKLVFTEKRMLFVIDIGNSHTVTGVYDGETLVAHWRLTSDKNRTADEIAIRYFALFEIAGINPKEIEGMVISSVVPTLETAWIECCEKYFSMKSETAPFIVSDQSVGQFIEISVDNPSEVGADRLVNGIAAWQLYKKDLVVIDFGTAITFDCVSSKCQYLGGTILPGIKLSLEALSSKTAKLPHIDVTSPPEKVIGTNTVAAMKSGILYGYGAMINGLISVIKKEMLNDSEKELVVIATGGMAELIAPYADSIDKVLPLLTLQGLKKIHEMSL